MSEVPVSALQSVIDRAADDIQSYGFPAADYGGQEEADAAQKAAWAEIEVAREWLASIATPPAADTDFEPGVYRIEMWICGTAYIRANSEAEALTIAQGMKHDSLELQEQDGDIPITNSPFDDDSLPDISLSPAMTIHHPAEGLPELMYADDEDDGSCKACGAAPGFSGVECEVCAEAEKAEQADG